VLGGVLAALAPAAIGELNDVDLSVQGGVEEVQEWLSKGPLGLSETRIGELVDRAQDELRARSGTIAGGALGGAVIALEVIAGVLLTIVLLFFFIRDGERLWRWIVGLAPEQNRRDVREIGMRAWDTLGGYLRGTAIVAFFDAALIGLALSLLGVPLALPLAVLTFFGAFVPLVGAVVAGFAAAMVALVSEGFFVALIVVGVVIVVQQVEGDVLQPLVVGKGPRAPSGRDPPRGDRRRCRVGSDRSLSRRPARCDRRADCVLPALATFGSGRAARGYARDERLERREVRPQDCEIRPVAGSDPAAVLQAEEPRRDEARHCGRLGEPEAGHARDQGCAAATAPQEGAIGALPGRGDQVARQRDALGPRHPDGQLLRARVEVATIRDQAEDGAAVEEERRDGAGGAGSDGRHGVPEVGGESRARVQGRERRDRVRACVPQRRDDARARDGVDRRQRPGKLRRERHEPDEPAGQPFLERGEIDGRQLLHRDRAGGVGVQERPLEVEPEAERIRDLLDAPSGEQVARDTLGSDRGRLVDLEVDEAGKNERIGRAVLEEFDRDYLRRLPRNPPAPGPLDRVYEKSL
jgi:hypothetical protein